MSQETEKVDFYMYLDPRFTPSRGSIRVRDRHVAVCVTCSGTTVVIIRNLIKKVKRSGYYECFSCSCKRRENKKKEGSMNFDKLNKKIRVLLGTIEIFSDQYKPKGRDSASNRRVQIKVLRGLLDDMEVSIESIRTEIDRLLGDNG